MKTRNTLKVVEIYTRHNKRTKDVDIRKIKREFRDSLENYLGFLLSEEKHEGYTKEKYYVPTDWFITLEFKEYNKSSIHIYQRVTLIIEHFGHPASYPLREGQLRLLIKEHGLRRVKNKEEK